MSPRTTLQVIIWGEWIDFARGFTRNRITPDRFQWIINENHMYLAYGLLCQQIRSFIEQTTSVVNLVSMTHWDSPKETYDILLQCHCSFLSTILDRSLLAICIHMTQQSFIIRTVIASRNDDNWSFLTSYSVVAVCSWRLNGGCCSGKRQEWWLYRFCCL